MGEALSFPPPGAADVHGNPSRTTRPGAAGFGPPRTSAASAVKPSIEFISFRPDHLALIVPHASQGTIWVPPDDVLRSLAVPGISTTGILRSTPDAADVLGNPSRTTHPGSIKIVGSAGVLPVRPGLAQAWAVFGDIPKRCWPAVVGRIRVALERAHLAGARRVEAQVRRGFGPGCRLARLVGFEVEGILRSWGPDGSDFFMYSKLSADAARSDMLPDAPGFAASAGRPRATNGASPSLTESTADSAPPVPRVSERN